MQIFFLGLSGFPSNTAAVNRQKLISKALVESGNDVTIICKRSVFKQSSSIQRMGIYDNINYRYLFNPIRNSNFYIRNIKKILEPFIEFYTLLKLKITVGIDCGIVSFRNEIFGTLKYFFFSKILNFSLIISLVEIYDGRNETRAIQRINDYLFNNFGLYFYDAYLPISDYIIRQFKYAHKRFLYLPILVDFNKINIISEADKNDNIFTFCGAAGYPNHIRFLINVFKSKKIKSSKLLLITYGSKQEIQSIRNYINEINLDRVIQIKINLTNEELYTLYKSSRALLLPLFDTIQDRARFPHKLGEYLASGTPIIATQVGEIEKFLYDQQNVLFVQPNDSEALVNKILWVIEHPTEAKRIGEAGKEKCRQVFDYKVYKEELSNFIHSI